MKLELETFADKEISNFKIFPVFNYSSNKGEAAREGAKIAAKAFTAGVATVAKLVTKLAGGFTSSNYKSYSLNKEKRNLTFNQLLNIVRED